MKISSLAFIVLAILTLAVLIPPKTYAISMSPLVNKAGSLVCQGEEGKVVTGCRYYLHARITENKGTPTDALTRCNWACGKNFGETTNPVDTEKCRKGCKIVFDLDK